MSHITPSLLSQDESTESEADQAVVGNVCDNPNSTVVMLHIDHVENLHQGDSVVCYKRGESECTDTDQSCSSPDSTENTRTTKCKKSWIKWTTDYFGITDSTCGLRAKLLNYFKTLTLPRVAWLDEGADMPINDYYIKLQLDNNKQDIAIEEIFKKVDRVRPTRILIEGQPGYGKTTLATKIAHDWGTQQKYLERYEILFLIPLRVLQGKTIYNAIKSVARQSGFRSTEYDVIDIIGYNSSKTLLILDGLDELSLNDRESILKILYRQIFDEVTVVVTCRQGLFKLQREEQGVLFGEISRTREFHDKKITVLGVNHQDRRIFLQKFTSTENADKVIAHLDKLTEPVAEIFKSPLLVILLAFIAQKKQEIVVTNKTDLYVNLFNCMIRQSLEKNGIRVDEDFDIFDFNDDLHAHYKELFSEFGKLALKQLNSNNMQFKETELTKNFYQLGVLIRHNSVVPFESKQYYEAIHLSILEFAAALFLFKDYKENNFKFTGETCKIVLQLFRHPNNTSMVLPFLVGLMGKNSNDLFALVKPMSDIFAVNSDIFWKCMDEQYPTTVALNDVIDFMPRAVCIFPELPHIFYSSFLWGDMMSKGISSGKVVQLSISNGELWKLPRNNKVPLFWVNIPQQSPAITLYNEQSSCIKDFQCEKLILQFQRRLHREIEVRQYFSLLTCIRTDHKCLWLQDDSAHHTLFEMIDHGLLSNIKLQFLYCELTHGNNTIQFLEILLKNNQVEELEVNVQFGSSSQAVNKLTDIVSSSEYLNSFTVILLKDQQLDFNKLTKNGSKKWKRLMIAGGELICEPITAKDVLIDLLVVLNYVNMDHFADVVPTLLTPIFCCNAMLLKAIQGRLDPSCLWYKSVVELGIDVGIDYDVWENVLLFTQIQTLQLTCRNDTERVSPFFILNCIKMLQISKLKILWQNVGLKFIGKLFAGERGLTFKSSVPETLRIVELFPSGDAFRDNFDALHFALCEILECIKCGKLDVITVFSDSEFLLRKVVRWDCINLEVFDVTYSADIWNNYDHALLWGYTIYTAKLTIKLK